MKRVTKNEYISEKAGTIAFCFLNSAARIIDGGDRTTTLREYTHEMIVELMLDKNGKLDHNFSFTEKQIELIKTLAVEDAEMFQKTEPNRWGKVKI